MEITVKTKDGLIMAQFPVHSLLSLLLMDGRLFDVFVDGKFIEPPFKAPGNDIMSHDRSDDRAVERCNYPGGE